MILCVGKSCLDIVMLCSSYPEEDSDQRCISSEWRLGGNAANSCKVLAEFGAACEYLGVISADAGGRFVKENLERCGICIKHCIFSSDCSCPTSVVLVNSENGSRTIVHSHGDLPSLTLENFTKLDLKQYQWIHFEVQHSLPEIKKMITLIDDWNTKHKDKRITISVEIEKPKPSYSDMISYGDVVFVSKDFSKAHGFTTMVSSVEFFSTNLKPGSSLICPWGENGACAKTTGEPLLTSISYPPAKVVNTLAAGDTFIAAAILSLNKGRTLQEAIENACRIAGAKCGLNSTSGLRILFPEL